MSTVLTDQYGRTFEERKEIREKLDRLNAEAKAKWDDPAFRALTAAELTNTIYMGFEHENLLGYLTQLQNAPFDARVFVKETRGLRAFWLARGGYIEASDLHAETIEMPRDTVGFHVWEFEDKLLTSFAETQSTLVELGGQRLDAAINGRFFSVLQAAVPSISSSYISGAGLSLAALNTALRGVRDTSRTNEVTIVGRSTMTQQIMDLLLGTGGAGSNFLPQSNEDMVRRGILGTYRGARIIELVNWKDDTETSFFPANELWIIGRDASQAALFGPLKSLEFTKQGSWEWHYMARRDFGAIVTRPENLRRIVDTSQSA